MPAKLAPKKRRTRREWREAFLATLRNTANVRAACEAAGVTRVTAYDYRDASDEFRQAWQSAMDDAIDVLEAVARKRASEISDTLLIFLLKSHRPGVYRDTINIEHSIRRAAAELGLDPDEAVREAQAIVRESLKA